MSSIKMVALRKHPFGVGEREAGEEYDATRSEADILIALGWGKEAEVKKAAVAPPPAPVEDEKPPMVETKDMDVDAKDKKRVYQRRDMKAKD